MNINFIAMICHNVLSAANEAYDEKAYKPWRELSEDDRNAVMDEVRFHVKHPQAGPEGPHNAWLEERKAAGWTYGKAPNTDRKKDPDMVEFKKMPVRFRLRAHLIYCLVNSIQGIV